MGSAADMGHRVGGAEPTRGRLSQPFMRSVGPTSGPVGTFDTCRMSGVLTPLASARSRAVDALVIVSSPLGEALTSAGLAEPWWTAEIPDGTCPGAAAADLCAATRIVGRSHFDSRCEWRLTEAVPCSTLDSVRAGVLVPQKPLNDGRRGASSHVAAELQRTRRLRPAARRQGQGRGTAAGRLASRRCPRTQMPGPCIVAVFP